MTVGDEVWVRVLDVERQTGKIRLTMKGVEATAA
jgi:ribosomal protein S1